MNMLIIFTLMINCVLTWFSSICSVQPNSNADKESLYCTEKGGNDIRFSVNVETKFVEAVL